MKLNPPKKIVFLISMILGAIGIIAHFISIPVLSTIAFWLVVVGLALLVLGNTVKGL